MHVSRSRLFIVMTLATFFATSASAAVLPITGITSTADENPEDDNAILQSISTTAATYTVLTSVESTSNLGTPPYLWGENATDPGSAEAAITDLDAVTGVLSKVSGADYFFPSATTIDIDTAFFMISNGTDSPGDITLVDVSGSAVTSGLDVNMGSPLLDVDWNRSDGGTLSREIRGAVFKASDFTFNSGKSVSDVAGLAFNGGGYDPNVIGIAAVPEPTAAALIGVGGMLLLGRRRGDRLRTA